MISKTNEGIGGYPKNDIVYIEPTGAHTHTLIFLHGLGDSGDGIGDLFKPHSLVHIDNLKVVLPTAPKRPVSCNNGAVMNSWFDILSLE